MKGCTCSSCQFGNVESNRAIDLVLSKRTFVKTVLRETATSEPIITEAPNQLNKSFVFRSYSESCKYFNKSFTRLNYHSLMESNLCWSLYNFLMLLLRHQLFNSIKIFLVIFLLLSACPLLVHSRQIDCEGNANKSCHGQMNDTLILNNSFCQSSSMPRSCSSFPVGELLLADISNGNVSDFKCCDEKAREDYEEFSKTMNKYITPNDFIISNESCGRCNKILQCLYYYKQWVCSTRCGKYMTTMDRFKVCIATEKLCPIFRIFDNTKIRGGQPVFLCRGFQGAMWRPNVSEDAGCEHKQQKRGVITNSSASAGAVRRLLSNKLLILPVTISVVVLSLSSFFSW